MSASSIIALRVNPPTPAPAPVAGGCSASPPPVDDDVASLTRGLVVGCDEAFTELHARYYGRLCRYLTVVCRGDAQAAEEALQETWLRVARHVRRFETEPDLWRWLAALARCAAVDGSRRRSRYRAALDRYLAWFRPEPPLDAAASAALERLDALLEAGLEALPPDDRDLLVARYRGGRSVRALAGSLGVSEKALESRLFRLRTTLRRQLLERWSHEDSPG